MMKQLMQISITWLKIPTDRGQTSWLRPIKKHFIFSKNEPKSHDVCDTADEIK